MARSAAGNRAEQCPLCPDTSDFDLLSDGKRVIDLNSEVTDRTFHFLVAKQKLDRTQVAGATVDQGRLRAAERVRAKDMARSLGAGKITHANHRIMGIGAADLVPAVKSAVIQNLVPRICKSRLSPPGQS